MRDRPLAYHVTFGTYGTRLHGDARGTVDRGMNQPGDPIIGADRSWWELERDKLRFDPMVLSPEQMIHVESVMPEICTRGGWTYHVGAGGPDHVHALLTRMRRATLSVNGSNGGSVSRCRPGGPAPRGRRGGTRAGA